MRSSQRRHLEVKSAGGAWEGRGLGAGRTGAGSSEGRKPEESEGTARERLLEHVTALCAELSYDSKMQLEARAKAAKMSDEDIRMKAIRSLGRLIEQRRGELTQAITAELERMGLDAEQMAGYVGANGGQGKALDACSLAELRLVADSLELL